MHNKKERFQLDCNNKNYLKKSINIIQIIIASMQNVELKIQIDQIKNLRKTTTTQKLQQTLCQQQNYSYFDNIFYSWNSSKNLTQPVWQKAGQLKSKIFINLTLKQLVISIKSTAWDKRKLDC
eukprot:TRINITY_DN14652_c1_g1_i1.p5 TRINITY_DN14652_c1_g1~~TRINITY_DN14652_c1_g1_i1.p5  ORF type:complete len:123 (+),score=1.49 TRINITY_DN14652_c1_g1_i1:219-587(+)